MGHCVHVKPVYFFNFDFIHFLELLTNFYFSPRLESREGSVTRQHLSLESGFWGTLPPM